MNCLDEILQLFFWYRAGELGLIDLRSKLVQVLRDDCR